MPTLDEEKQKIREVIDTWADATRANDVAKVLSLMTEDAVFLVAGRPPMRGRSGFAEAFRALDPDKIHIDSKAEPQEIEISGDMAYCWNFLRVQMIREDGAPGATREGPVLTIFRKVDGAWLLSRDANLLTEKR